MKNILSSLTFGKREAALLTLYVLFVILCAYPLYANKHGCDVARPGYTCESAYNVIVENCRMLAKYNCNLSADPALPQLAWYTQNLCKIAKKNGEFDFPDCENVNKICNLALNASAC